MGNSNNKRLKVIAEERMPKEIEDQVQEEEEKKAEKENPDLKISKNFSEIRIEKAQLQIQKASRTPKNPKSPSKKPIKMSQSDIHSSKAPIQNLKTVIKHHRSSISIKENEVNTMKGLNSTNTSLASLDLGLAKSTTDDIRRQAYISALQEELLQKGFNNIFVNDAVILLRSYMNIDQWNKIFEITSNRKSLHKICIGIENSFNSSQKIKIICFDNIADFNSELNRIGKYLHLKCAEIGGIKDFLIRINRKTNNFYVFLVEKFYEKSLEKLIKSQHQISDSQVLNLLKVGVNAILDLEKNKLVHGSVCPNNFMITLQGSKLGFILEMKTDQPKFQKFPDNYSLGITLLSVLTCQSYETLSNLNHEALFHLISPLNENFKNILEILICKVKIPISLISKFVQNWKLNGYKHFEFVSTIKDTREYFGSKIGNYIFVCSLLKDQKIGLKVNESVYKEILSIEIWNGILYLMYRKGNSCYVSEHDILSLDPKSDSFQDLELNEFIRLPDNYFPSLMVLHQEIFYFFGGKYRNLPTSKCYKCESGMLESLDELSCTSGFGESIKDAKGITYIHFGKFAGTIEHFIFETETWIRKKIPSHQIKMLEKTFIINLGESLLGITSNEVVYFREDLIHLMITDESTKQIIASFDTQAFFCIPFKVFSLKKIKEGLYAVYRQKKNEKRNESILFASAEENDTPEDIFESNLVEKKVLLENSETKISLYESDNENHKVYFTKKTRKIDRTKENFDDVFISSLTQSFLSGKHLLTPLKFEISADKKTSEISFNFTYKGGYKRLEDLLIEGECLKDTDIIRFLSQATRSIEHLKQNKFYFLNFKSENVILRENLNEPLFIGFEHESKFVDEKTHSNVHKENMLSLALLAFRMATGYSQVNEETFGKLSSLMKGILKPLLEGKEDERPNSLEYYLFLKKGKRKRWREIFFTVNPNIYQKDFTTNCCVGIENKKKLYLLEEGKEFSVFDGFEGRYGCFSPSNRTIFLFTERKIKFGKISTPNDLKEMFLPNSEVIRWNAISSKNKILLIGGEFESVNGKLFSPEVYEANLDEREWKRLPEFPETDLEGKFQMFIESDFLYVVGFSSFHKKVVFGSLEFENRIEKSWKISFAKWKADLPKEQILVFIGPNHSTLVVGLFHSHGLLFSRQSEKAVKFDVFWRKDSAIFAENKKFGVGNGITWDGNFSRILVGTSVGVFIFTCKIEFLKSIAAITLKPISSSEENE